MISPETLRRFPFFFGLDESQLKALAMIADQSDLASAPTIFEEGNPANKFYLLVDGSVDLYVKSEEEYNPASRREFAVGEINPGEVFGIGTLLEPYKYSVTARCPVNCVVLEIDGLSLRAIFQVDKIFAYLFMLHTSKALIERLTSARVQLAAAWS
jgi:CRP-like cAMP-binding protein